MYWTPCEVVACDAGREFGFEVGAAGKPVNTWRYVLEASGNGTDVTESFELTDTLLLRIYWSIAGRARGRTNRDGMRATLERIRDVVEAESGAGG